MSRNIKSLVKEMTLEEKAGMCSGKDFWHLKAVERLNILSIMVSDGPHGLRKQTDADDNLGINASVKSICFPAASATASSFDRQLLYTLGEALGEECQSEDIAVLLGPGINIKRSPLCGRNFEYFSEDPYLAGELASAQVKGLQSKNVGACLKHYACNNQEKWRMYADAQVDERTLREIYLTAFEIAVKTVQPWTMMCSFNRVNGAYSSQNKKLLNDILRDEWGYEGFVVTDWGAVNDRVTGLEAGLDLEMPGTDGVTDALIVEAVKDGKLPIAVLDQAVERILNIVFKCVDGRIKTEYDKEKHHNLATKMEEESAVLLKNENDILPLSEKQKVLIIGEFAEKPRFQGGGSSHINATKLSSALDAVKNLSSVSYLPGFSSEGEEENEQWFNEAVKAAQLAEVAVIFAGLPDSFESECYDRSHMQLPNCQNRLIEAVCEVQKNIIVVLHNGSPVEMPWIGKVKAVLELYLGGQGVGQAAVNLLYGKANPCGKLAESFPVKMEDNPSFLNFPGDGNVVEYREGVFVGYRYYDAKKMKVLFPFGHGLSYTKFAYSNLRLDKDKMKDSDTLTVYVDVTNSGTVSGKEIIQLYVSDKTAATIRPEKELKGFVKVELLPGETKTVEFILNKRSFAWYNTAIQDWYCASGEYLVLVGASSQDIRLSCSVNISSTTVLPFVVDGNTLICHVYKDKKLAEKAEKILSGLSAKLIEIMKAEDDDLRKVELMELPFRTLRGIYEVPQEKLDAAIAELNKQ